MLARRKRLMLVYGASGLAVTLAAAALVLKRDGDVAAYRPGETLEGITSSLARDLPEDRPQG